LLNSNPFSPHAIFWYTFVVLPPLVPVGLYIYLKIAAARRRRELWRSEQERF